MHRMLIIIGIVFLTVGEVVGVGVIAGAPHSARWRMAVGLGGMQLGGIGFLLLVIGLVFWRKDRKSNSP
ncbi:MAG: hypothetical protein PHU85_02775 [Phycisphaerae bacterium]|nr:hypothetical protein [Phycisphaerae bacterium]